MLEGKIEKFRRKYRGRADNTLKVLAEKKEFVDAFNSDLGSSLLADVVLELEKYIVKIYNEDITKEESAEFRVLKKLNDKWTERINSYNKEHEALLNELGKL